MADVRVVFTGDARDAVAAAKSTEKAIDGVERTAKRTGPSLQKLGYLAVGGFAALGLAAKVGFDELAEGEKVAAQTGAVLKSTGGVANVTAKGIGSLAMTLSNLSGVDDEAIQSGENLLLTFTNVRNEVGKGNNVFDQATKAALNMSVALGTDMKSSAMQVGKALNEPVRGLGLLRRAGVSFTKEQEKQVDALVKSGKTMDAQKVILKELETQFGGSAKAAGETLPGQINKAKVQFENLSGNLVGALLPALTTLASALSGLAGFLSQHKTLTQALVLGFGGLAVALGAASIATSAWNAIQLAGRAATAAWTAAQWLLNAALTANPIGVVVVALAALVAGLIVAWQKSETFREIVTGALDAVKAAADAVIGFFRDNWKTVATLITAPFLPLIVVAKGAFGLKDELLDAFRAIKTFIGDRIDDVVGFFQGLPDRLVKHVTSLGTNVIQPLKNLFTTLKTWIGDQVDAIVDLFRALPDRLLAFVTTIKNAAAALGKGIFDAIVGALKDFGSTVANILKAPINAVIDAINNIKIPGVTIRIRVPFGPDIKWSTPEIDPFPDIPRLAKGALGFPGGLAMVGEKGPELAMLPRGANVIPNHLLRDVARGAGMTLAGGNRGGGDMHVHVHADGFLIGDSHALGAELARLIVGHRVASYPATD